MFEKEAEEYADGIYHYKINVSDYGEDGKINYRYSDVKEAHQKGAEFGYNKANEWHNVKDGDLPKENKEYVVKVKEYGGISVYIGRYWKKEKMFTGSYLKELDVIKWKEIE